ncbi:SCAR5-like protein [Mya arenaria]|uniref:SCAR5-like protein n=1 Tax=Mya arenaria TaxID=6604 RepID=A0ABY7G7L1_MYAAR|nr:SCAR5-like protein [Mya arenaria]
MCNVYRKKALLYRMRFVQLGLIVCLTALTPIQGSRLNRLEEDVDALKRFMFRELLSIRDQVKDISIRVDTLENATVMQDPSSTNQYMDIHSNNIGDETGTEHNEARLVKAEVQNMRKAYANDKKDLHQLTNDVKGQLRELEQKITSHMHNLTAEVQHNIEYIHKNLSLANVTLSEFINVSNSNVSIFSDNIKMEIKKVFASSSEDLELRLNETEEKIKSNISLTYSHIEDELERFMSLADRNVSEMMLKAHSIFKFSLYFAVRQNEAQFNNGSTTNISTFSQNIKMKVNLLSSNTSEQLALRLIQTETKLKHNISSTYQHYEDKIESFISLADRNVSEMMLKADNNFKLISTNFSEMPNQLSNLSLDLQSVSLNIQQVEEKQKHLFLLTCNKEFMANNGTIQDGNYYPCSRDIRLANASLYSSTGVQVRHDNMWGTVCDDSIDGNVGELYIKNNVNVVCRVFGFRECDYVIVAGLGLGSGDIWMDNVKCGGEESSFIECTHNGWGVHNCGHNEDIGFNRN